MPPKTVRVMTCEGQGTRLPDRTPGQSALSRRGTHKSLQAQAGLPLRCNVRATCVCLGPRMLPLSCPNQVQMQAPACSCANNPPHCGPGMCQCSGLCDQFCNVYDGVCVPQKVWPLSVRGWGRKSANNPNPNGAMQGASCTGGAGGGGGGGWAQNHPSKNFLGA